MPVSNFLISGFVAYPFHQAVQLIGSTAQGQAQSIRLPQCLHRRCPFAIDFL